MEELNRAEIISVLPFGLGGTKHRSLQDAFRRYCLLVERGFHPALFEGDDGMFHVSLPPDAHGQEGVVI